MLFLCPLDVVYEKQMEPHITVGIVMDVLCYRKKLWPVRAGVKRGVESPVKVTPGGDVGILIERAVVCPEDLLGAIQIVVCEKRDGVTQEIRFQQHPDLEHFDDFFTGKRRNHRAMIVNDPDESFRCELPERFANGNATDVEFGGDGSLPQLLSCLNLAA